LAAAFPFVFRDAVRAIAVMAAAGLSDVLDGWVARNLQQETPTGAVLDGVMDKLFALTVLVTLVLGHLLSPFEATVLSLREVIEALILVAALVLRPHSTGAHRPSNALGKLTTVFQFATVVLVLLERGPRLLGVYVTGACGALAAAAYGRREFQRSSPSGTPTR
jgi:cardiolipin synthase (CMP-forming)